MAEDSTHSIERLGRNIQSSPRNASLHRSLGLALWKSGNLLDALIEFRKVQRIEPDNLEALFAQAAIYHGRKRPSKAFEILFDLGTHRDSVSHFVDFPQPYAALDWALFFATLAESVKFDHLYFERAVKEGQICLEQKCFDKAIRIFTRLIGLNPREPEYRLRRAIALSAQRRDEEAETELKEILLLQPRSAPAYKGLALLQARRGENEKARSAFEELLKLDPSDIDARRWLDAVRKEAV